MPTARKRARAYDPAKIRAAVQAQLGNVREAVRTLTPEQLALRTRLGEWTVRELVAHIGMAVTAVHRSLDRPAPARQDAVLLDWPFATSAGSSAIADFTRDLAQRHPDQLLRLPRPGAHLLHLVQRRVEVRPLPAVDVERVLGQDVVPLHPKYSSRLSSMRSRSVRLRRSGTGLCHRLPEPSVRSAPADGFRVGSVAPQQQNPSTNV
jgi:hypothetical protein